MAEYTSPIPDTLRNRGDYEAPHMSPVTPMEDFRTVILNRVSVGAVGAGVMMALAVQFVFSLLGIGIGVTTMESDAVEAPMVDALSASALSWWSISGIIAGMAGGFIAGRMAGDTRQATAGLHGLTAWAASTVIVVLLVVGGAGALIGGTLNVTGIAGTIFAGNATPVTRSVMTIDAETLSSGAFVCAVALILGAVAAWYGGRMGVVKPTLTMSAAQRKTLH